MRLLRICGFIIILIIFAFSGKKNAASAAEDENNSKFWENLGGEKLKEALSDNRNKGIAKNVIFFVGDGMGPTTVTAMRIYKGQKKSPTNGKHGTLSFDNFPYVSLSKTNALDRMVSDSANAATAFFCGVKANFGTIGVNGKVKLDDCRASLDKSTNVASILQWAQNSRKGTGIVTTKRVTDATPAALYSHSASRFWEATAPDAECKDIAQQLIRNSPGKTINVIFGGGRGPFLRSDEVDEDGQPGERTDNLDLIAEWKAEKKKRGAKAFYVSEYVTFNNIKPATTDYVLGLFNITNMPYASDKSLVKRHPSLPEMTKKAIEILQHEPLGYFLMVEGAKIDSAHHENSARKALEEGLEFDEAINVALKLTSSKDTLIIVTADHSHPFTIAGDHPVWSDILGLGGLNDVNQLAMTILSYANGPGFKQDKTKNFTQAEVVGNDFMQDTTYPMKLDTHSGEDVAVYATGPMAHLFCGVHEQSYIPYALGYASCIGPNISHCQMRVLDLSSSAVNLPFSIHLTVAGVLLYFLLYVCQ